MEKTRSLPNQEGSPVFDNRFVAQTANFLDEVLFAMTVYRHSLSDSKAWTSLEAALSPGGLSAKLFVYDNSPQAQDPPHSLHVTAEYHHDPTNPGISAACNAAYRAARGTGRRWLLFLDQDTSIDAAAIAQYAASVSNNPSHSLFAPVVLDSRGVLSPFRFTKGRGIRVARFSSRFLPLHEFRAINAGLLVSCDLFGKVGGYEEAIAVDFSDIAFLEKVKAICDCLCRVDAILEQQFSGSTPHDRGIEMERFKKYNEGALEFTRRFAGRRAIRWGTFLRAMKLTLQWRRMEFLKIHFKIWGE